MMLYVSKDKSPRVQHFPTCARGGRMGWIQFPNAMFIPLPLFPYAVPGCREPRTYERSKILRHFFGIKGWGGEWNRGETNVLFCEQVHVQSSEGGELGFFPVQIMDGFAPPQTKCVVSFDLPDIREVCFLFFFCFPPLLSSLTNRRGCSGVGYENSRFIDSDRGHK